MKGAKIFLLILILAASILYFPTAKALPCNLDVSLINQDPYPAVPGDYVEVVFQINGVSNPTCGKVDFTILPSFPFALDPGAETTLNIRAGTYSKDYSSFYLAPFKLRVDREALDGENQIEVVYSTQSSGSSVDITEGFNITVEDQRTTFEVNVKDYEPSTNTITFEILNTGENNIDALTVDIPKQDNIVVKGSPRNIIGSLDANEDTTFTFEGIPEDGPLTLHIIYTDQISVRRELNQEVTFDSSYFTDRARDKTSRPLSFYLLIVLIVGIIAYFFYKRWKKKKAKHKQHHATHHR